MKKIYLVRHGESEGNVGDFMQDHNTPLSREGEKQSRLIAEKLKSLKFDLLISSPLRRTVQTAEFIKEVNEHEIVLSDLFRERERPSRQYGLKKNDPLKKEIEDGFVNTFRNGEKYEDAESFPEIKNRAIKALNFLKETEVDSIVVVTHGTFSRIMAGLILSGEDNFNAENCLKIARVFKKTNTGISSFVLEKGEEWRIYSWNDFSHLG